jgi:hypothetical protein
MGVPYQNTISSLLKKRGEMMGEAQKYREEMARIGNDIDALDRTLIALGFKGDLKSVTPRGNRIVCFHRDELRRFILNELRQAEGPISSRDIAEKIIGLEGKDGRDRGLRNDMAKRVGKSLKLIASKALRSVFETNLVLSRGS